MHTAEFIFNTPVVRVSLLLLALPWFEFFSCCCSHVARLTSLHFDFWLVGILRFGRVVLGRTSTGDSKAGCVLRHATVSSEWSIA